MLPSNQEQRAFMDQALALAQVGRFTADPNPLVGCVIVRDGLRVGGGGHLVAGEPHAEIHALAEAGHRARGADVYVTLEPCAHTGRTGPCANALIAAGVGRVFIAMEDPNPLVAGEGRARLEAAGIGVFDGPGRDQAEALNRGFLKRHRSGRPFVVLKSAASLDGRTALEGGESRWISNPRSRARVHERRAAASAVMTGVGTVLADDPALTARVDVPVRQPLRVVLDGRLRCPPGARVIGDDGRALIVTTSEQQGGAQWQRLRDAGAELVAVAAERGRPALPSVLEALGERDCNEVLVEAGSVLAGALLEDGLVDEWIVFLAPHVLGPTSRPLAQIEPPATMADRRSFVLREVRRLDDDLELVYACGPDTGD